MLFLSGFVIAILELGLLREKRICLRERLRVVLLYWWDAACVSETELAVCGFFLEEGLDVKSPKFQISASAYLDSTRLLRNLNATRCARLFQVETNSFLGLVSDITELEFPSALVCGAFSADVEEFPEVLPLCQAR